LCLGSREHPPPRTEQHEREAERWIAQQAEDGWVLHERIEGRGGPGVSLKVEHPDVHIVLRQD